MSNFAYCSHRFGGANDGVSCGAPLGVPTAREVVSGTQTCPYGHEVPASMTRDDLLIYLEDRINGLDK